MNQNIKYFKIISSWIVNIVIMALYILLFFSTVSHAPFDKIIDRIFIFSGLLVLLILDHYLYVDSDEEDIDIDHRMKYLLIIISGMFLPIMMWFMFQNVEYTIYLFVFSFLKTISIYINDEKSRSF